jgi:hypothetical protein
MNMISKIIFPVPREKDKRDAKYGAIEISYEEKLLTVLAAWLFNNLKIDDNAILMITNEPYRKKKLMEIDKSGISYEIWNCILITTLATFDQLLFMLNLNFEYWHIFSFSRSINIDKICLAKAVHEEHYLGPKLLKGVSFQEVLIKDIEIRIDIYEGHKFIWIESEIFKLIKMFENLIEDRQRLMNFI